MSEASYKELECSRASFDDNPQDSLLSNQRPKTASLPGLTWNPIRTWLLHGFLLTANIITAVLLFKANPNSLMGLEYWEYAPLRNVISYKRDYIDLEFGQPSFYTGMSGPQVDDAWDDISAPPGKVGIIKVQEEELKRMNLSSIPLADGSGYVATLDVFHQLHCLDRLRKATIANDTAKTSDWHLHVDHCIDSLRLSLQCHADTSLLTFKWVKDYRKPWPDFRTYHVCRNFEDIRTFAADRWFEPFALGILSHPQLGALNWSDHSSTPLPTRPIQYLDIE